MTLFKQIAVMLSIFLIIVLITVMTLNFQNSTQALQERLYEDAKNSATSLSLTLGTARGDISIISTMINANFDSGEYLKISLIDVEDKLLYQRTKESQEVDVPKWFMEFVKIEAPIASANVSAGWSQVGILNVQSDTANAYLQLYTILKNLLISFSILGSIALAILNLILVTILKPLKEVQKQAEAIIRNEFIVQKDIPHTKEFRDVVLGMNTMVLKVKAMFDKGNEELKRQKELEYIDAPTKLKNRKYLIAKLPQYLKIDANADKGIHMLIGLNGVIEANESIGHQKVDSMFVEMAKIFRVYADNYKESIVARMNGTEFSILLPNCKNSEGVALAQEIQQATIELFEKSTLDTTVTYIALGLYEYHKNLTIAELLSLSDNALSKAKFEMQHIHLEKAQQQSEIMGKTAWRDTITQAIQKSKIAYDSWKVVNSKNKKIDHYVLSLTLETKSKKYSYGEFMPIANTLGLSNDIYKNIIHKLFKSQNKELDEATYSLRLSNGYLEDKETYKDLSTLLHHYAHNSSIKLIIEIQDKLVNQNLKNAKLYKELFQKYNIDIGIYEFIGESHDYTYLQDIRPIYLKGEANYFITQQEKSLSALKLITESIGISLIATSVMDKSTLHQLEQRNITIIQGRATEML